MTEKQMLIGLLKFKLSITDYSRLSYDADCGALIAQYVEELLEKNYGFNDENSDRKTVNNASGKILRFRILIVKNDRMFIIDR